MAKILQIGKHNWNICQIATTKEYIKYLTLIIARGGKIYIHRRNGSFFILSRDDNIESIIDEIDTRYISFMLRTPITKDMLKINHNPIVTILRRVF